VPELDFNVVGVEAANRGLTPLLQFKVAVTNKPQAEQIHTVTLQTQIQLQPQQRAYSNGEKAKLVELFGTPDRWGQTLRNRLWGFSNGIVRGFVGSTEAALAMPCTFDLNVAASKYFHALDSGEVSLLFLFSGSIFYEGAGGKLQVRQISWNKECVYRMPVAVWKTMMDHHFPNYAWLTLGREVFDRLHAYKRSIGATSWDQAVEGLLNAGAKEKAAA
jgi:hypothetical protein